MSLSTDTFNGDGSQPNLADTYALRRLQPQNSTTPLRSGPFSTTTITSMDDGHPDEHSPSTSPKGRSHAFAASPRRHAFFDPAIAQYRSEYLKFYFIYTFLLILLMWALLPIYWASLAYSNEHVHNLVTWVVDRDQDLVGAGVLSAVQQALSQASSSPTLGWQVVPSSDPNVDTDALVANNVVGEKVWAALVVNANATASLRARFLNASAPVSPSVTFYFDEGRNELASFYYIRPIVNSLLASVTASTSANLSAEFLSENAGNQTAIQAYARALSGASGEGGVGGVVTYELDNLRPFSAPVSESVTLVGMILLCIFSFILTMANNGLRPIVARHLTLPHYTIMRVVVPMIAYLPLSLSFSIVSLPFHLPFNGKYTEAQGFFLFWIISYLLMCALGLATEFAIGALTIKFAPFFLLTLIITNVSVSEFPLELLPGIFRYGRAWLFYNASQAFRTIMFDTKSHLAANIPILLAWMLVSVCTVALSTWIIEGRNRRRGIELTAEH